MKNRVELGQSGGRDFLTVYGIGNLKGAFRGRGLVYSSIQGVDEVARLNCQFELSQPTRAEYTIEQGQVTLNSIQLTNFPVWALLPQMEKGT